MGHLARIGYKEYLKRDKWFFLMCVFIHTFGEGYSNEGPSPFSKHDICDIVKIHWWHEKFFSRTTGQILIKLFNKHLCVKKIHNWLNEGPYLFPLIDSWKLTSYSQKSACWFDVSITESCFSCISGENCDFLFYVFSWRILL